MPVLAPARILGDLNRGLVGQMLGAVVTCCVAHISPDGAMTLAKRWQPRPLLQRLRNAHRARPSASLGDRSKVCRDALHACSGRWADVCVGRGAGGHERKGELFGFERTQSISGESTNQIAKAAEWFGQEDDITVLTVMLENTGASASTPISVPAFSA